MAQKQIINYFRKADHRFLTELNPSERAQAIQQFQSLWLTEMPKVSNFLNRRHKVISNREELEQRQQNQNKQIASSLRVRMQKHFQKRENFQIQKLKNYKNLDRVWKDKMLHIKTQARGQQKKNLQRYKQISKEIEQFWNKKKSPSRSHSKSFSPKSQSKQSNYFKSFDTKKQGNQDQQGQFRFVTQARMSKQRPNFRRSPRSDIQLPTLGDQNKLKTEVISQTRLMKTKMKRTSTQTLNHHAMKSNQQWKTKQHSYFQNAMEKIDKILNIRMKVRQNLKGQGKKAKNSRLLKESVIKDRRYFSAAQVEHPSPHQLRHINIEKKEVNQRKSRAEIQDKQSQVQLRRKDLSNEDFKNRESTFLQQKEKQRRSKFHRMVRDAINIYRLQALRQQ